ncbi:UNVERIFIED_CONTAM: hypothetical protein FKN15_065334 [Acipenser sinensis]
MIFFKASYQKPALIGSWSLGEAEAKGRDTASVSVGDACNAVVVFLARVLRVRVPDLPCGFNSELVFPDGGSTPIRFPEYNMQCERLCSTASVWFHSGSGCSLAEYGRYEAGNTGPVCQFCLALGVISKAA